MNLNFEKFEKAISIYRKRQEQINTLKAEQDKARNYISKYVSAFGTTKTDNATCSCVTRTKIEYDIKAIKAKFAKALYSQFIDDVILVEAYNLIPFLYLDTLLSVILSISSLDLTKSFILTSFVIK